jgi:hypothetical protein
MVLFPLGDIALNELEPYFGVFFCEVGRGKFKSVLIVHHVLADV